MGKRLEKVSWESGSSQNTDPSEIYRERKKEEEAPVANGSGSIGVGALIVVDNSRWTHVSVY